MPPNLSSGESGPPPEGGKGEDAEPAREKALLPGPSRKRRRRLFRLLAVLFPIACVVAANAILYFADVGTNTTLVIPNRRGPAGEFYFNPRADAAYNRTDLRGPEPRAFRLPKPEGTFRVVVVGASSVQGYPFGSELAFPRQMELFLSRQLSGRRVEVLNAGVVGLSTVCLVDLVARVVAAEPDVVVVYAGHNEFYGVGGVATNTPIGPIGIVGRRFRLIQIVSGAFAKEDDPSRELISRLPRDTQIPLDSELVSRAERVYELHLRKIADICRRKGVPLVLCSVASNLRDQSPIFSFNAATRDTKGDSLANLSSRANRLFQEKRFAEMLAVLKTMQATHADSAEIAYRVAQCLERLGRHDDAREQFAMARDLDGCRYRAPRSFNDIVRRVAAEYAGASYVDLAATFARASRHSASGSDLFLEHVHFNLEGHRLAAVTIARGIVDNVLGGAWNEQAVPSRKVLRGWLGVVVEDEIVAHKLASFLSRTDPFKQALEAGRHARELDAAVEALSKKLTPQELRMLLSLSHKEKVDDLVDGLGRAWLSAGRTDRAMALFELGKKRRPWMPNSFIMAAKCKAMLGDAAAAQAEIDAADRTPIGGNRNLLDERDRILRKIAAASRR